MEALYQALKALDSKTFENFCFQLLKERHQKLELRHIDGKAGDEGIDVFVGELFSKPAIWQAKAFPDGVGESQKKQIRHSLRTALKHFKPKFWILCSSVDMDIKARRWFERLKKSYESKVKIDDFSASEIVNELIHRRPIRNAFFPGVVLDVAEMKRLIAATGELSTEQLEKITDENVEDLIERYKDQDARFRYEIVFDGDSGPTKPQVSIPSGLMMSVLTGTRRVNVYARDITALRANPPHLKFGVTGTGIKKMEFFLDTGISQELELNELGPFTSDFPLLKAISPQKLTVSPSPALTQRKRSVRVIFQKGAERVQYNLMEMSPLRAGRKEWAFRVSSPRVPLRIEYVVFQSETEATTNIKMEYEDAQHDLRELKKSVDALDLLRPSGQLLIFDLEMDKPLIEANVQLPALTGKQVGYRRMLDDLVAIADRFKVEFKFPAKVTKKDLEVIALLKRYMENGCFEVNDISMTLVKSDENKDLLPEQFANGKGLFRLTHERHMPIPKLFGAAIDTGPVAMDVEAEIKNLHETLERFRKAKVGSGLQVSFRPTSSIRVSLLSSMDGAAVGR